MPEDKEPHMIVAGPYQNVAGSKQFKCLFCGSEIWVSPATQKYKDDNNAAVICTNCYVSNPTNQLDDQVVLKASREELVSLVGEKIADDFIKHTLESLQSQKKHVEPWKV